MDRATYWSTKSPLPEYWAVTFDHPAFSQPFRLVANQFAEVVLAGAVHTPAPMSIKPPEQKGDTRPRLTVSFPREVVGRIFKQELARVAASASREPIVVVFAIYLGQTDEPQTTWRMFVADGAGVAFNSSTVQVSATVDNPMERGVSTIYDPATFTGLAQL